MFCSEYNENIIITLSKCFFTIFSWYHYHDILMTYSQLSSLTLLPSLRSPHSVICILVSTSIEFPTLSVERPPIRILTLLTVASHLACCRTGISTPTWLLNIRIEKHIHKCLPDLQNSNSNSNHLWDSGKCFPNIIRTLE